ncbi:hypothetical protein [Lactiplantibacillus carotarum]|uniref:hypothetical protein n=1 Tax=Lactiplantibacillus carotarum TaxID=2993456 RepID=UPI00298F0F1B|nr:hypothetical protein [Lactiplantibacillus carotarum]
MISSGLLIGIIVIVGLEYAMIKQNAPQLFWVALVLTGVLIVLIGWLTGRLNHLTTQRTVLFRQHHLTLNLVPRMRYWPYVNNGLAGALAVELLLLILSYGWQINQLLLQIQSLH